MDTPNEAIGFLKNAKDLVTGEFQEYKGKMYLWIGTYSPAAVDDGWVRGGGLNIESSHLGELQEAVHILMDTAATDKTLGTLPAGKDQIHVGVQTFRGEVYAYIRRFYEKGGQWLPTRSGVNVRVEHAADLVDLIDRLVAVAPDSVRPAE